MKNKALIAPNLDGKTTDEKIQAIYEYALANNRLLNKALQSIGTDNMESDVSVVIQQAIDSSKGINTYVSQDEYETYIAQTAKTILLKANRAALISEINLSAEGIGISSDRITLTGYTSINNNFNVDVDGKFHANAGSVAGWTFEPGKGMYYGVNDASVSPSLYLGTVDLIKSVVISGSASRKDWRLKIGSGFGITKDGDIYCDDGYFRGKVNAGKINYGTGNTVSGEAITVYTIVNSRVASHTLDESAIESAYANLKSNVSTMLQYYTGGLRAGSFYCSYIDATGTINYRGNSLSLLTATIGGTTIHYVAW